MDICLSTSNNYKWIQMTQKSLPISFRLSPEKKQALETAAEIDSRSVSSLLDKIISDWLRENGHLPK